MAKRRSKGEGSIYKRSDGLWVAQINVSAEGAVRRRKTLYGKTKSEVVRKMSDAKKQRDEGNFTTSSMTFGAWLDHWLAKVVDVRPGTKDNYSRQVRLYIKPELGKVRLDRLNLAHVERLHDSMSKHSPATIKNAHRTAGNALQAAMRAGLVVRNPFKVAQAPKAPKPRRRALSNAEFDRLEAVVTGRADESRWLTAIWLGPRQGECLGLTWDRVDFDRMILDFEWQAQRIKYKHGCSENKPCGYKRAYRCHARSLDADPSFEHEIIESNICWVKPKTTASRRIVPIPLDLVGPLRRRYVEYLNQRQTDGFQDHGLVWAREDGRPLDDRADYWNWRGLLDEAGVTKIQLHAARNSAATRLLRQGVDPLVIREILGHSDVVTTQSYQRADLTLARAALDAGR